MDKYDKIFLMLLILSFVSGIIETWYSFGYGDGTINFGFVILFPLIIAIYTIYIKYVKKEGRYSRMLGVIGNIILFFAVWAFGGVLITLLR